MNSNINLIQSKQRFCECSQKWAIIDVLKCCNMRGFYKTRKQTPNQSAYFNVSRRFGDLEQWPVVAHQPSLTWWFSIFACRSSFTRSSNQIKRNCLLTGTLSIINIAVKKLNCKCSPVKRKYSYVKIYGKILQATAIQTICIIRFRSGFARK